VLPSELTRTALVKSEKRIATMDENHERAGNNERAAVALLKIQSNEIWGDVDRRVSDFSSARGRFNAALGIVRQMDAKDPRVGATRAKLLRKLARVELLTNNEAETENYLATARSIIDLHSEPWALYEAALIAVGVADLRVKQHKILEADTYYAYGIDLLSGICNNDPSNSAAALDLAETLQKRGDVQRRVNDVAALDSYNAALALLERVAADDPTSYPALSTIDLVRHSVRLLGPLVQTNITQRHTDTSAALDTAFMGGVGKFRFGMGPETINTLLQNGFSDISNLPIAGEYEAVEVRYLLSYLKEEQDAWPFSLSACLQESAYVTMLFHENALFRLSFRFMPGRESCPERSKLIDGFAQRYGLLTVGPDAERRFKYETSHVGVIGFMNSYLVWIEFIQR
jgi:tetratricopeptide (TPR) repeat protein